VVITGGSSVGLEDLGPVVLRKLGELPIHGLHMRPASPSGIGFVGDKVVVLCPGYPVSSYVAWDMIARRVIQRMLGLEPRLPYPTVKAKLAKAMKKPNNRVQISRVVVSATGDGFLASNVPGGSALLSTVTRADGFVVVPEGTSELPAGAEVDVFLYEVAPSFAAPRG
jgi:molybdopterin molybdotransferase